MRIRAGADDVAEIDRFEGWIHGHPIAILERAVEIDGRSVHDDDVDVLALALHLDLSVWTDDADFEDSAVGWHTTAELLEMLGIRSR